MSSVAALNLQVSANVAPLATALQRGTKSLQDFKDQLARLQGALANATDPGVIDRLNRAIAAAQSRINGLTNAAGNAGANLGSGFGRGNKSLQDLQNQLARFQTSLTGATNPATVARLNRAIEATQQRIRALNSTSSGAGNTLGNGLTRSAGQASFALTNLGRVAQDLPFGFIGIANNLNPLLESFTRLRAETGSNRAAFRALGSSLIGPAGIGLALSLVSAAILIFQNGIGGFNKKAKEAKKSTEDFAQSLKDAEASALSTGLQLQNFVDIAKNGNLPLTQRNQALKEANKLLGDHGTKLTLVNIATKEVTEQIDKFTEATINQALATKYADRIADQYIKLKDSSKDFLKQFLKTNDAILANAQRSGFKNFFNPFKAAADDLEKQKLKDAALNLSSISTGIGDLKSNFKEASTEATKLFGELGTRSKESKAAKGNITTIAEVLKELNLELKSLNANELNLKTDETENKIKATQKAIDDLIKKVGLNPSNPLVLKLYADVGDLQLPLIQKQIRDSARKERLSLPIIPDFDNDLISKDLSEAISKLSFKTDKGSAVKLAFKVDPKFVTDDNFIKAQKAGLIAEIQKFGVNEVDRKAGDLVVKIPVQLATFDELLKGLDNLKTTAQAKLTALGTSLGSTLESTIENALAGIGESIGNLLSSAFAGAALNGESVFGGLFKLIGDGLKTFGKALIEYGVALKVIKLAIKNPTTAILGGIALIAAGTLLQNSLPKFATGVQNFGGGYAMVGERGPEMVRLPRGSDVIPNGQVNAMGGQQVYIPAITIRGSDLVLAFNRASATINRNG